MSWLIGQQHYVSKLHCQNGCLCLLIYFCYWILHYKVYDNMNPVSFMNSKLKSYNCYYGLKRPICIYSNLTILIGHNWNDTHSQSKIHSFTKTNSFHDSKMTIYAFVFNFLLNYIYVCVCVACYGRQTP